MNQLNSEKIMMDIQKYIDNGIPYIEAIVDYADREGLEIEVVGEIIRRSPVLKSKIHQEAEELNLVERTARLPV